MIALKRTETTRSPLVADTVAAADDAIGAVLDLATVRPSWWGRAACRGRLDVMVPSVGDRSWTPGRALATCATCPVLDECRAAALASSFPPAGVLGGLDARALAAARSDLNPPAPEEGDRHA